MGASMEKYCYRNRTVSPLERTPVSNFPNILGEFSGKANIYDYLIKSKDLGYAGAWVWAYRAKDKESIPALGEQAKADILRFALENPNLIEFK